MFDSSGVPLIHIYITLWYYALRCRRCRLSMKKEKTLQRIIHAFAATHNIFLVRLILSYFFHIIYFWCFFCMLLCLMCVCLRLFHAVSSVLSVILFLSKVLWDYGIWIFNFFRLWYLIKMSSKQCRSMSTVWSLHKGIS